MSYATWASTQFRFLNNMPLWIPTGNPLFMEVVPELLGSYLDFIPSGCVQRKSVENSISPGIFPLKSSV